MIMVGNMLFHLVQNFIKNKKKIHLYEDENGYEYNKRRLKMNNLKILIKYYIYYIYLILLIFFIIFYLNYI